MSEGDPVPDKAERKQPVQIKFSVNEAGLEMIIRRMSESGTDSSVPALVIRGYLRRMARGALAKIQKWTSMRTRILGNFRVPPRGSAADLSEIVPGGIACRKVPIRCGLAGRLPVDERRKAEQA